MKKILLFFLVGFTSLQFVFGAEIDKFFLSDFMVGDYEVVGRAPDSEKTYAGKIRLYKEKEILKAIRTVEEKSKKCVVKFDTVAGKDKIPVMRLQMSIEGVEYEATYLWSVDADNYPIFTGRIYRTDNKTKNAGIEAFFPIKPR